MLWLVAAVPLTIRAERVAAAPQHSSAAEVIAQVNALRAEHGLPAYQTNSILMKVCQDQSDYMASIGTYSDYDAQGRGSGARALAAGYPLAGDLSRGGLISENVYWGTNATAAQAISFWTSDAMHRIALFDTGFRDTGAGVTVVGNAYFYCQIAALSTGGAPQPYTPAPPSLPAIPAATIVVSTPNTDGSIVHVIHSGDTVGAIASAYGVPLADIYRLNNINANTIIYPGHKLIIQAAASATPIPPTPSRTRLPTATPWPSSTPTDAPTSILTPTRAASVPNAGGTVVVIAVMALLLVGAVSAFSIRSRS